MSIRRLKHAVGAFVAVFVVVGVFLTIEYIHTPAPVTDEHVQSYAPDFALPDSTGNTVRLSDVHSVVRVVNFWASWSPYSATELPALARLKEVYGDQITIIALNRDTDPHEGRAFLEQLGLGDALLFVYDRDDTYYKQIGGFNMPETLFVGKDERVLAHVHGPMDESVMSEIVSGLLATP